MPIFAAGVGQGLARLLADGHPAEWAVVGVAVVLGWVVLPSLIRRGKFAMAFWLAAGLFLAGGVVAAWCGRPSLVVVGFGGMAAVWVAASVFLAQRIKPDVSLARGDGDDRPVGNRGPG